MSTGEFWSWPFVKIMPFEPLIRAASSEEQFALHQSLDYLRKKGVRQYQQENEDGQGT